MIATTTSMILFLNENLDLQYPTPITKRKYHSVWQHRYFLGTLLQCSRFQDLRQLAIIWQLQGERYILLNAYVSNSYRNNWRMSKRGGTYSHSAKVMSTRSAITDTIFAYFITLGAASFFLFINIIICNRCHSPNVVSSNKQLNQLWLWMIAIGYN